MIRGHSKTIQEQKNQQLAINNKIEAIKALLSNVTTKLTSKEQKQITQITSQEQKAARKQLIEKKTKDARIAQLNNLYNKFDILETLSPQEKFNALEKKLQEFLNQDNNHIGLFNDKYQTTDDIISSINTIYQRYFVAKQSVESAPTSENRDGDRKPSGDEIGIQTQQQNGDGGGTNIPTAQTGGGANTATLTSGSGDETKTKKEPEKEVLTSDEIKNLANEFVKKFLDEGFYNEHKKDIDNLMASNLEIRGPIAISGTAHLDDFLKGYKAVITLARFLKQNNKYKDFKTSYSNESEALELFFVQDYELNESLSIVPKIPGGESVVGDGSGDGNGNGNESGGGTPTPPPIEPVSGGVGGTNATTLTSGSEGGTNIPTTPTAQTGGGDATLTTSAIETLSETTSPTVIGGGGGGATPPSGRGGGGEMKLEEVRKKAAEEAAAARRKAAARDELLLRSQLVLCYNEKEKIKNTQFDSGFDSMKNEWKNEEKVQEWSSSLETIVKNQRPNISDEIYNKIFTTDPKQNAKNILIRDAIAADTAKKIVDTYKVPFSSSNEEKKVAKDIYKDLIKPVKKVSDLLLLAIGNEVNEKDFSLGQPIFSEISDITYKQAFKILTGKEKSKDIVEELKELGSGQIADDDRSETSEYDEPDEEIYQKLGDNESFAKEVKAFEATLNGQRQEHFYQELVKKAKDVELVEKAKDVISNKFSVITEFIDLQSRTVSKDDKDDKYELLESLLNKDKNQVIDDNVIKDAIIWHLLNNNEEAYGVLISHGKTLEVKLGGQKIISQYTEEEIEDKPNTIKEFIKGNQSHKNKFVNEIILLSKVEKTSRQNDDAVKLQVRQYQHLSTIPEATEEEEKEKDDTPTLQFRQGQNLLHPIPEATPEEEKDDTPTLQFRQGQNLLHPIPEATPEEEKDDDNKDIVSYDDINPELESQQNQQNQQNLIKIYGPVLEYVGNKENEHPTGKDLKQLKAVFSNKENHITIPRETKRGMPKRDVEYTKHLADLLEKQREEHTQALKELKEQLKIKERREIKQKLHEELQQELQGEPQQKQQKLQELQELQELQQERREKQQQQQQEQQEQELNDIVKNVKNTFGVKSSQGLKTVLKKVIEDNYYDNSTQASLLQNFIQEQLEPKITATKNKESLMSKAASGAYGVGSAVVGAGATVIGAGATVIGAGAGFVTDNPITRGLSTASDTILERTGIGKPTHPFPRAVAAAIVPSVALGVGTVGVAVGAGVAGAGIATVGAGIATVGAGIATRVAAGAALGAGATVIGAGATVIGAGATVIGAGAGFVTDNPITRGLSTASDTILDRAGIDKPTHPFLRAGAAAIVPSVALGAGTAAAGVGVVAGVVAGAGSAVGAGIAAVGIVASGAEHLVRKASGLKTSPVSPSIIEAGELLIKNTAGRIAPDSIKNNIPSLSVQVREWMTAVDLVKIHKNYRKVEVEEGKSDSVWKGKDRKISFKVHKNVYSEKGDKTDWYEKEENAVNVQTAICLNIINNMVGRNVEEKVNNFVLMYNISKHFGGLSHKFDDKGKVIRDRDGKPELLTVEDVNDNYITKSNLFNKAPIDQNKLEEFQKLSREFQKECKEAGIVSGRDGSEKGLRFTFLSQHVLDKAHTITSSQCSNPKITIGQDLSDALDNAKAEMASKKTNKTR